MVANEKSYFNIAVKSRLSEIGRGYKDCFIITNKSFGMQNAPWPLRI